MKDKNSIYLAGVVSALVILTSLLWITTVIMQGKTSEAVMPAGIIVIILLFMIPFVKRRYIDVKKGYPAEDERSKKVINKALAQAYLISLYWLLALGWASDGLIEFRDVSQAMGAGIAGMAAIFGLCYLYYNRKGG